MAVVQSLYYYSIQPKRKTGIFFFQDPYINIIERLFNHMPVLASTIVVRRTWYTVCQAWVTGPSLLEAGRQSTVRPGLSRTTWKGVALSQWKEWS